MPKRTTRHGRRSAERKAARSAEFFSRNTLAPEEMLNERFVAYYKAQKIIPDDEWDNFLESLRRPLPTTFRIAGSRQTAKSLGDTIKDTHIPLLSNVVFEDEAVPPPSQIPWYPDGLAWQFNVSKRVLRTSPEFKKFHSFLVHETTVGNISRQEAVSMLPPLLLDVQPHHKVIDMCAAPGSKTAQLLEALHANDTATATSTPPGLLIANDSDSRRAHLLIHQSARLPSPSFMVTNLDASIYPVLRSQMTEKRRSVKNTPSQLLFDRILCDVPCSGDGTIRKNAGIWKRWQPLDGNGLHGLQVRILQRAMRMLEPDGRIVYSTCSLNPVENEAVIAAALNLHPEFELVDVSSQLRGLIRRPGVTDWLPTVDRSIDTSFFSWEAYIGTIPENKRAECKMFETHWPPSNASALNLERCIRIYPHLQDTGGFFVAVLARKQSAQPPKTKLAGKRSAEEDNVNVPECKKFKAETDDSSIQPEHEPGTSVSVDPTIDDQTDMIKDEPTTGPLGAMLSTQATQPSKVADPSFKEMPYTLLSSDDATLAACIQQLHLTPAFPSSNVLVRNPAGDAVRSLYLINDRVKSVLAANDYTRMRLMTAGTKVITRQDAASARGFHEAHFRILGEGMPVVLPYVDPGSILSAEDDGDDARAALRTLLETYYPLCTTFKGSFRTAIEARGAGCHVVRFPAAQSPDATLARDLVLPLWKSNVSVSLMIDKKAKSALSLRLYGEDVTLASGNKKKPLGPSAASTSAQPDGPEEESEDERDEDADADGDYEMEAEQ